MLSGKKYYNHTCYHKTIRMKIIQVLAFFLIVSTAPAQQVKPSTASGNKAGIFITNLMAKMTLDEKIGQLNLLTPGGGILTGSVVSSDVEAKIKAGNVGGLFGVIGVDKIKQAQQLAMTTSRLKIPLIFGSVHESPTIQSTPVRFFSLTAGRTTTQRFGWLVFLTR